MTNYLYEVFQTSTKNHCNDLTIALAMFLSDARQGKQEYGPDGVDYQALHQDYQALAGQEQALRQFIGGHYQALVKAYKTRDRAAFEAVVEACKAADAEEAKGAVEE